MGRVMGTIFTFSIAGVVASLLLLARVAPPHEWLFKVTFALLGVGAVMYSALPWLDDPPTGFVRTMGVVLIVLAAFAVTIPVVHWLDRGALAAAEATTGGRSLLPVLRARPRRRDRHRSLVLRVWEGLRGVDSWVSARRVEAQLDITHVIVR